MDGARTTDVSIVDGRSPDGFPDPAISPDSSGYALGDSAVTDVVPEPSETMLDADVDMGNEQPHSSTHRTRSQSAGSSSLDPLDGGERGGYRLTSD